MQSRAATIFVLLAITISCVECVGPLFKVFAQSTPIYRGRADPILSPGAISSHVHRVFGASGFNLGVAGLDPVSYYDDIFASTCTTGSITIDKSAYWIPDLYYQWPNGSFSEVPNGGITVYYFGRSGNGAQANPDYQAFPPGFRMLAGNANRRNFSGSVADTAIRYACLAAEPNPETNTFPTANLQCINGLRTEVFFPQCWDGVNLDSPNHQDHVAYPIERYDNGNCPDTHPVRIPAIFYEVLWSVDQDKFPHGNGVQPFVWAMGDPTGNGLHGDFLNGWDQTILHAAMHDPSCLDNNTNEGNQPQNCLPLQPYVKAENPDQSCLLDQPILNYEDIGLNHWISHLPGNNPVTQGPGQVPTWIGSYQQEIDPTFFRVLLKSVANGLYVSSLVSWSPLTANVSEADLSYPQVFDFVPVDNGQYAIATESSNKWVSSNRGTKPITGDRRDPSDWEYWTVSFTGGTRPTQAGTIGTLFASNGKYVSVQANGELISNAATVSVNEQFWFIDADAGVPDTRPANERA